MTLTRKDMDMNELCGNASPDRRLYCLRAPHNDETHEACDVVWKDPPVTPADERAAFWASVTRHALISGIVLIECLIMLPITPKGLATVVVQGLAGFAGLWLVRIAWMVGGYVIDSWRDRR